MLKKRDIINEWPLLLIDGERTTVDGLLNEDCALYTSHNDAFVSLYTQQMHRQRAVMVKQLQPLRTSPVQLASSQLSKLHTN